MRLPQGKNKEFFGGVYKGKDHVLDSGDYLVSEVSANFNSALMGPANPLAQGQLQRYY
jgi:hypothetical protein